MRHLPKNAYGLHLLLDGYGANSRICDDETHLHKFLKEFPSQIGMKRLAGPFIKRVDDPEIAGLSGFVFIFESHISVHTYIKKGFITADVYSCKAFDSRKALNLFTSEFQLASVEKKLVVRGTRFG